MQYNYDGEITVVTTTIPFVKDIFPIGILKHHTRAHTHDGLATKARDCVTHGLG